MGSGQSIGKQLIRPPGERRQTASRHFDPTAVDWVAVDWVVVCSGGMGRLVPGWGVRVRRVADESGEIRTKGQRQVAEAEAALSGVVSDREAMVG
jgi:hypothetical protein